LFGHEKGSFTGAHQRHVGKFEQADKGTLLLDEITEIEAGLQAKLLRVLQEKEIERIGGNGPVKVNTRIIATTNRDIKSIVNSGNFRQDLYYRLYVIHLEVPPLRERVKDVELMSKYFLKKFCFDFSKPEVQFSDEAMGKLKAYSWPGNVRELQNVIQRSLLMCKANIITAQDLALSRDKVKSNMEWIKGLPVGRKLHEVEIHFILETLKKHNGNRTHAAKTLGISLRTLRNKINEFTVLGYEVPAPTTGKAL
jgi:two-component system response regulator AtoC